MMKEELATKTCHSGSKAIRTVLHSLIDKGCSAGFIEVKIRR